MIPFQEMGKILIIFGGIMLVLGVILMVAPKIPFPDRLPGDITIKGKNFSVYIPVVSCLVLSWLLTIIINIFFRR